MEKKYYIAPDMQVVSIAVTQLMAGSPVGTLSTDEGNKITSSDDIGSRDGGGFWDDEE